MNVRPLSDRILVRRVDAEEQVKGGHYHPRYREGNASGSRSHCRLGRANAIRMATRSRQR